MKITDIALGTPITIDAYNTKGSISFNSVVEEVLKDGILIQPLRKDNMSVGFDPDKVRCDMTLNEGEPRKWLNCEIKLIKNWKDEIYHYVRCESQGLATNRRNSFRQFLGIKGVVRIGENTQACDCLIKDISSTGIAFILDITKENVLGSMARISFIDMSNNFSINAEIVRILPLENACLYGCKFTKTSMELDRYIAMKQRNRMQGVKKKVFG